MASGTQNDSKQTFSQKVWVTTGIVALVVVTLWILKSTFSVLLLILAGALIALYFHGLSSLLHRKLHVSEKVTLPVAIIGSIALLVLFLWFAGDRIQQQAQQLSEKLPAAFETFKEQINKSAVGKEVIDRLPSSKGNEKKIASALQPFFRTTFGVLGDLYVVLFLGLFFIVSPHTYINGMLKLVPPKGRSTAKQVSNKIGSTLIKWLKGQIFSMLVVFVLTAIGLAILGVPLWLVLALLAGLLSFVPNFGPLIAIIPAVLIGFLQGTTTALLVFALYILVQVLESNLITPKIQQRLINIPPALIIVAQLFMGVLTGGWGLVLAMPLVAMLMVVLQQLYIEEE